MKASQVPTPVKVGVTAAMAVATYVGATKPKSEEVRKAAKVGGVLATIGYLVWAFGSEG